MAVSLRGRNDVLPFARDGWRFILLFLGIALALWVLAPDWCTLRWIFGLLGVFCVWFFRDPNRVPPGPGTWVVAPADGKVVYVDEVERETPDGETVRLRRIGIFLSVFNAHIQRAPVAGRVTHVVYKKGGFVNALDPRSSEQNEANTIWMESAGRVWAVRQIAGIIARRIVCVVNQGQELDRGERLGLIRFGSRTELFCPLESHIVVEPGRRVKAGLTVLAELRANDRPGEAAS